MAKIFSLSNQSQKLGKAYVASPRSFKEFGVCASRDEYDQVLLFLKGIDEKKIPSYMALPAIVLPAVEFVIFVFRRKRGIICHQKKHGGFQCSLVVSSGS